MILLAREKGISLIEALACFIEMKVGRTTEKQKASLKGYLDLIKKIREKANETLSELVHFTITSSSFYDILKGEEENFEEAEGNVEELLAKVFDWETAHPNASLPMFLEELTLKVLSMPWKEKKDKVNLMTVHNGKGLEFAAVFLVGMESDLFPHVNSRDIPHAVVQEERRLCYVGMTRAKERLFLSAAKSRFIWGTS